MTNGDPLLRDCRFNPRAREGRDKEARIDRSGVYVSIHAPARGATLFAVLIFPCAVVSIHAPARGATST